MATDRAEAVEIVRCDLCRGPSPVALVGRHRVYDEHDGGLHNLNGLCTHTGVVIDGHDCSKGEP